MPTFPHHTFRLLGRCLLAVALGLFLAGCSLLESGSGETLRDGFARLRDTARSVVSDPDRLDHFVAYSEGLEAELLDFEGYAKEFAAEYRRAFTDYDSEQADLRRLSEEFRARQGAAQQRFVELHLAMAGSVTASEWRSLQKQEARIIQSLLDAATRDTG